MSEDIEVLAIKRIDKKGMVPPGTNRYSGGSTVCDATPQAVPMAAAGRPQPVACDRVQVETVG